MKKFEYGTFRYITIGGDGKHMILCKDEKFDRSKINKLIIKAFPALLGNLSCFDMFLLETGIVVPCFPFRDHYCMKNIPFEFNEIVSHAEQGNDWDRYPFVKIEQSSSGQFCFAPIKNF